MNREIESKDRAEPRSERATQGIDPRSAGPPSREHDLVEWRGYTYRLSPAEVETMQDIGRFRTVAIADLARHRYAGQVTSMQQDLSALRAQGLVQLRRVWSGPKTEKLAVAVLTKLGKEIVERCGTNTAAQATFAGFVKPAEVRHDAAIYRMYQAEKQNIEHSGGQVRRVVLDYELKQRVYSPLAKAKALGAQAYAKRQSEVAQQNGLTVIKGKILLPDLRIEFETSSGELAHVDLELATEHYHGPALQDKAQAGFKMYASADSAAKLTSVLEERDIIAAILSL